MKNDKVMDMKNCSWLYFFRGMQRNAAAIKPRRFWGPVQCEKAVRLAHIGTGYYHGDFD